MTLFAALLLAVVPTPGGIGETVLVEPATATATAVRVGNGVQETPTLPPPATRPPVPAFDGSYSNGRCVGAEALLQWYSPGWSSDRMAAIAYRESRCEPGARNTSSTATGLLQILSSHCPWIAKQLDTWCTRDRLTDPYFNIRAAAVLWQEQGYGAWSTS